MKRLFLSAALALLATSALAQTKISELPAAGALTGTEEVPAVQAGGTVKTTTQDIADLASATPGGSTTQVQYNNAGAFAGDAGMVYNASTDTLTLLGNINVSGTQIFPNGSQATPTTGGTTNMAAGKRYLYMVPAGTIATYTVNLPSSPTDGQTAALFTTQTITALTIGGQGGNTVTTTIGTLPANTGVDFMFFSGVWRQTTGIVNLTGVTATSSGVTIGSATGGAQGAGSINAQALYVNGAAVPSGVAITTGTFTATWETACTTNPTQNWKWIKVGSLVTLTALQGFTCTSDSTTFTASFALPVAIRPDASQRVVGLATTDNGTPDVNLACLHVEPDGSMSVRRSSTAPCVGNTFTNSGTKGFTIQSDPAGGTPQGPQTFTYDTDVVP
jgi:hypothetical protein